LREFQIIATLFAMQIVIAASSPQSDRGPFAFEQKTIADIVIDYTEDPRWGWIPGGWRITEMLSDGSKRQVTVAKVTGYSINVPIGAEEFR
jgi:hypothetical protein